jgi:predicted neuraminidase
MLRKNPLFAPILLGVIFSLPAVSGNEEAIVLQEFIYEKASFPSCHASTLVEAAPGHILAAWFGGTDEGEEDVGIWISHRENDSWSEPVEVARHEGVPCWNPVLWKDRNSSEILLFYKAGPNPDTWTGFLRRSNDGGKTWSETEMLPAGILGPIKNKPFQLEDGTLLCGSSVESWRAWGCYCEITKDLGRTWTKGGPINVPGEPFGVIQPTIFRSGPGELRMLMRSRMKKLAASTSKDEGVTWSDAVLTDLPNSSVGVDAVNLSDGRVALVYNHTPRGRSPLNLGISSDGGKTWENVLELENTPGKEFSYTAVIETSEKMIATTYTWHREKIRFVLIDPSKI